MMMSHDVLIIHVFTVASECTFSVGGWAINRFKSAVKHDAMEALDFSRNWLYADIGNIFFIYSWLYEF